jgi:predicted dehydrogenase
MVKEAREIVKSGRLGKIRKVIVEYPQGWLSTFLEGTGSKQASWRTDPVRSGAAGAMGDIGTHAENLAEYITGLKITELCADLSIMVEGRLLDDDGNVLLHFDNGAKGILHASQICAGDENNLNIRVYGELGGIEWRQEEPNTLILKQLGKNKEILRPGVGSLSDLTKAHIKIPPPGHPEGYLEAFANIYRNFARTLRSTLKGETPNPLYTDFPTVEDGVRGMAFIENVVAASKSSQKWYPFKV